MRYEDWDVLLFPKDSKVPIKEFKTQCHVVHDSDFAYTHGSYGLPTMTCFIPGLDCGKSFSISLHSWSELQTSNFTKTNFNNHAQLVVFEARIFIDGRLVASAPFKRDTAWPQLISFGFDFNRYGELENLKFPSFRSELLRQDYWSPADEMGRIKIIISEGFPRDSVTIPIERVKNLVAFSFQHAPIDILEASGIAWPNPSMWRRGPMNPTMPVPTEFSADGCDSHVHSPRRRSTQVSHASRNNASISFLGSMPNTQAFLQNPPYGGRPNAGDPTSLSDIDWASGSLVSSGFATTLTSSLLNQPMPAPCKSNTSSSPPSSRTFSGVFSSRSGSNSDDLGINLASVNPAATLINNNESSGEKVVKRSRHATPASTGAPEEEEPRRSTPRVRIGFGENMAS
ncbi:hypothetical protein PFICI_01741 [Pestalotiopsis fici W106-1]|uniref:Uncharacterized protein n=1 Tax=Pestalotiopsis fici (strain W106-1 / CGMCC3.15140) TaxID=1229662 RepID=W3XPC8_PESFW|nr:uncharacterized protein PFICI_01741 [Pestalotiopsis fici W106-1]ETS87913.1 hypothetical protein PFICI_01741 [Pestalotiopsis fici W106-1]